MSSVQGLFAKGAGPAPFAASVFPEVGVSSPKPGEKLGSRFSPSCCSLTQIFEDNSLNNDALYRLGITRVHLVPVVMSSVPLKRLYRELPVWIVEDHHDVSLAHWQHLTPYCPLFLVNRRLSKAKTCQLSPLKHTDAKCVPPYSRQYSSQTQTSRIGANL